MNSEDKPTNEPQNGAHRGCPSLPPRARAEAYEALLADNEALRTRIEELEDLEVQRLSEEQERFDSLNVLDEYAQQLEESRDELARLLRAGVAIEEARSIPAIIQTVADAVGAAGWGSAVVHLLEEFEVIESAFYGVLEEDIEELKRNKRPPEQRARMFSPAFEEFKLSRSYFVPANRLSEHFDPSTIIPGRREMQPGDSWDPMDLSYVPMYSNTGRVIGVINCDEPLNGKRPTFEVFLYLEIFADLAARKIETVRLLENQERIEAALRENEQKYRAIFNRSAESFFLMDDLFRECNEAACKLFNCERDDIIGHSPSEFSPKFQPNGQRSDRMAQALIERARAGQPQLFDWTHMQLDGTELMCEVSLAPVEVGGKSMIIAIVRDNSERLRSAREKETIAIASQLFLSSGDLDLVYSQLPKILTSRFRMRCAAIELYLSATDEMVIAGEDGTGLKQGMRIPADMTISGTVVRNGQSVTDTQVNRRPDFAYAALRQSGLQSIACVPLRVRDATIGVLWVGDTAATPTVRECTMPLQVIANYLAQAIDRRGTEDEMAALKQFYETLLDNLPAQVAVLDRTGRYIFANKACIPDEPTRQWAVGRTDADIAVRLGIPEEIAKRRESAIHAMVETSQIQSYEELVADSVTRDRYVVRVVSPVLDELGHLDHIISYGLDVTSSMLWEQEQRLLLQLPVNNPHPILGCSPEGKIEYSNQAVDDLVERLSLVSPLDLCPAEHAEIVKQIASGEKSGFGVEWTMDRMTIFWQYARNDAGKVNAYGVVLEKSSMEAESSQVCGHATRNPVWSYDATGALRFMNDAACDFTDRFGASNPRNFLSEDSLEKIHRLISGLEASAEGELTYQSATWRWYARTQTGGSGYMIELEDVTEVRELHEKLRHAQKLEAVGRLASGIAHDFNNLLTGILGNLDLLSHARITPEQNSSCIREAANAAERASALVRQLLDYSRKDEAKARSIDPVLISQNSARLLERTIDRRIHVLTEFPESSWRVCADQGQIEQLLMNLCVNAADALLERLVSEGSADFSPVLSIRIENVNNHPFVDERGVPRFGDAVRLSVSDNGCGMTPQVRARIFDAFYTTKVVGKGTGLGLAIVKDIVTGLGGTIEVETQHGFGSTFSICLPRGTCVESGESMNLAKVHSANPSGDETILLVDDEQLILDLGKEVLEHYGYRVITALDGQEAIEKFARRGHDIGLVIMDLAMPRMGGDEAVAMMLEERPDIPIILSSGLPESGATRRHLDFGSVAFIQKPYRPSELVGAVRSLLDHKNSLG